MSYLTSFILILLILYNAPVVFAYAIIASLGIEIKTHGDKELDKTSKIIILIIASIFSTALYIAFPQFFQSKE